MKPINICIIGEGSFVKALASLSAEAGCDVVIYSKDKTVKGELKEYREEAGFIERTSFLKSVQVVNSLKKACSKAVIIVLVVKLDSLQDIISELGNYLTADKIIVHTIRGIKEEDEHFFRVSEIIRNNCCVKKIGMLAGPNVASEIVSAQPAASVIASNYPEVVKTTRKTFTTPHFQVFESNDLIGVEIGSSLIGIYAIACGIASGLGYGESTKALIIVRAMAEISKLGLFMGADINTFSGLSGAGDLFVRVSSEFCPNYRFGEALGQGQTTKRALNSITESIDGLYSIKGIIKFVKQNRILMPILLGVNNVIENKINASEIAKKLISMESGKEIET